MAEILLAKPVIEALRIKLQIEVAEIKKDGVAPAIAIVRVGNRPDDISYEKSIIRNCQGIGIETFAFPIDETISSAQFYDKIREINRDRNIHGIMVFQPLPRQLDMELVKNLIDPCKDIDCINPVNQAKIFVGNTEGFAPCTPAAVIEMLRHYEIDMKGRNVVILGRSMVVGKPLSMLFLKEDATVTVCHSKSKNLPEIVKRADILVAAIGKARFVDETYVHENQVVIDVGINEAENGNICGDVNYERVIDKVRAITPVPGGVGSVTTAILMRHVVEACKYQIKIK